MKNGLFINYYLWNPVHISILQDDKFPQEYYKIEVMFFCYFRQSYNST